MISTAPVESFGNLVERFPGIDKLDPTAVGRFAFHAAIHAPTEDFRYHQTGEEYAEWHHEVRDILSVTENWRYEQSGLSRLEMAQNLVRQKQKELEAAALSDTLENASADEGYGIVMGILERDGYRVRTDMASSPLFPDGRTKHSSLADAHDQDSGRLYIPYGSELVDKDGRELDGRLKRYLEEGYPIKKAKEGIAKEIDNLGEIDTNELERLRQIYGTKAANLLVFENKVAELNAALESDSNVTKIDIPPFTAVSVEMYEAWLNNPSLFYEMCELARQDALNLRAASRYGESADIVAIRSSAVKSEDGDEHSGAGVYKSIAVDPSDKDAFRKAVEEVYASTRSHAALTYQQGMGVSDELMGLVIQQYKDKQLSGSRNEVFFGHANGRGANKNLLEIHTDAGVLLYDRPAVEAALLLDERGNERGGLLHTHPDHDSKLRDAIYPTAEVPHAVVLAEKLFGKTMQVEFVNNSIVQVRPLRITSPEVAISFPEELTALVESAASGFGDMELEKLDEMDDNSDRKGFLLFWREYEFSLGRGHAGYDAFPKEGAVIILQPSSSGHIQAICREKGLMCFYPKNGNRIDHIEDTFYEEG